MYVSRRQHRNGSGGEAWAARPTVGLGVNTGQTHREEGGGYIVFTKFRGFLHGQTQRTPAAQQLTEATKLSLCTVSCSRRTERDNKKACIAQDVSRMLSQIINSYKENRQMVFDLFMPRF